MSTPKAPATEYEEACILRGQIIWAMQYTGTQLSMTNDLLRDINLMELPVGRLRDIAGHIDKASGQLVLAHVKLREEIK